MPHVHAARAGSADPRRPKAGSPGPCGVWWRAGSREQGAESREQRAGCRCHCNRLFGGGRHWRDARVGHPGDREGRSREAPVDLAASSRPAQEGGLPRAASGERARPAAHRMIASGGECDGRMEWLGDRARRLALSHPAATVALARRHLTSLSLGGQSLHAALDQQRNGVGGAARVPPPGSSRRFNRLARWVWMGVATAPPVERGSLS